MMKKTLVNFLILLLLYGCGENINPEEVKINTAQGLSLLNTPLIRRQVHPIQDSIQIVNYLEALNNYENNKDWAENIIWLGRRVAYLGDYKRSIELYSEGTKKFPQDARFLRHRGHRFISIRKLDDAITDLSNAASMVQDLEDIMEPDGIPNKLNTPVSSLHTNIYYHLGLAYYLQGDFQSALRAYSNCLETSKNDDMQVATRHWLYMIYRRLGLQDEANLILEPITENMNIIENISYYDLLLFYKGLRTESGLLKIQDGSIGANEAAQYGIANWYFYNNDIQKAKRMFDHILKNGNWSAFGYLAAEADTSRFLND